MQKARKATPPMPRPAEDAADLDAPLVHRCPFCREGADANTSVVCRDCLTRHHPGCWEEGGGKCSSCQGTRRLEAEKLTLSKAIALLESHGYGGEEIKAVLAPASAPAGATRRPRRFLRRWADGVMVLALSVAVPMLATTILFGGILRWYGDELRFVHAATFAISFLVGVMAAATTVREQA